MSKGDGLILTINGVSGYFPKAFITEAVERYVPKKPTITTHKYRQEGTEELREYKFTHCPYCFWEDEEIKYFDSLVDKGTKHCRRCGQALDWSNTEKGEENEQREITDK